MMLPHSLTASWQNLPSPSQPKAKDPKKKNGQVFREQHKTGKRSNAKGEKVESSLNFGKPRTNWNNKNEITNEEN